MRFPSMLPICLCGFLLLTLGLFTGCRSSKPQPNLHEIYSELAQYQGPDRYPVIVIPGILGSRLIDKDSNRVVWGAFGGEAINPKNDHDLRLLTIPMSRQKPLSQLKDQVYASDALDRIEVKFLGLPIELTAYAQILSTLGVGGYKDQQLAENHAVKYPDDHYSCFQFAYDWRRDLTEHVVQLDDFIKTRKQFVAQKQIERYGKPAEDSRVDIVAHSMGGLMVRYYLRYGTQPLPKDGSLPRLNWEGAKHVRRVILIATPNSGSLNSLSQLVFGTQFASILPRYEQAALATLPSLYQLMPRPSDVEIPGENPMAIYDVNVWKNLEWGLLDPSQTSTLAQLLPDHDQADRMAIAFDHTRKCLDRARQLHRSLDVPASPPANTTLHLFAGDALPTFAKATAYQRKLHLHTMAPGDGTVTRESALGDLRQSRSRPGLKSPITFSSVQFLQESHIGLTQSPVFANNALYQLLEAPLVMKATTEN